MTCPVLASYQRRFSSSVTKPSWTMRLSDRSSGSTSSRFSRQRRGSAASLSPIMMRASEPPMLAAVSISFSPLLFWVWVKCVDPRASLLMT